MILKQALDTRQVDQFAEEGIAHSREPALSSSVAAISRSRVRRVHMVVVLKT